MENNEIEIMELPSSLDSNKNNKKNKRSHLFSSAIFKESFKSHFKGASVVGIANAALVAVVIGILSTLNINSTSTSMKNLFSNAGSETTIKEGAVSYYNAYYKSALAYDNINDSLSTLESLVATPLDLIKNESVVTLINSSTTYYNYIYSSTYDKETAINRTNSYFYNYIDSLTNIDEQSKLMFKVILSSYLNYYSNDNSINYYLTMSEIVPSIISSQVISSMSLDNSIKDSLDTIFKEAITYHFILNNDYNETKSKYSFKLAKILSSDEDALYLINEIEDIFNEDPSKYSVNENYYKEYKVKDAVLDKVYSTLLESSYYAYLPDFDINYKLSELGYPLTLKDTGNKDSNGNIIYKEEEVKEYDPSKFIEVKKGMTTKASTLEKMRKEIITGVPYTEEEIENAKEEASNSLLTIKDSLSSFLSDYVTRSNNSNEYYNNGINESKILSRSIDDIIKYASRSVVDDYNSKYDAEIKDILEITASSETYSGAYLLNKMYSYASSAISSYKEIYSKKIEQGYNETDASLIATNVSTIGIMDELPNKVSNNLSEMGDMNIYGIVIGSIGFAMACLLIPLVYSIMLANDLVCKKVENGSLAFTFSTPIKRSTFIFTEGMFLIFVETCLAVLLTLSALIARKCGILLGSTDLETSITNEMILKYGLGNYLVTLALSGICFFTSSLFNKTSNSIGIGGGLSIFFFICSILGLFGSQSFPSFIRIDSMNYFNYVTIITFFDTNAVITGDSVYYQKLIGLVVITLLTYLSAFIVFKKKDLPL